MAYIQNPDNVSGNARIYGNACIYDNARIYDNAYVSGNARVSGNACVFGDTDILVIGPAISSGNYTTAHNDAKIGVRVNTGCFSGSVQEFIDAIESTHKYHTVALRQYRGFVAAIKAHFGL